MIDRTRIMKISRTALCTGGVLVGLCLMMNSLAEARTYKVSSIREKTAQGNWEVTTESWQHIPRQESYRAQWALEMVGLPEEDRAKTQLLDSTGSVLWEGETGDILLLSSKAPAFAVASHLGSERRIYNLRIGREPVYEIRSNSSGRPFQSRDGTAFGLVMGSEISIVSIEGELLGSVRAEKSMHRASAALSDGGAFLALGETGYENRGDGGVWHRQVSLYDRHGALVCRIDENSERYIPRSLALSADIPPRIAIGTDRGVSFWLPEGNALWNDSTAFVHRFGGHFVEAMYVTDEGRVLALTTRSATDAALWTWDSDGLRESKLDLPPEFDASNGADFIGATDSSVTIQSHGEVLTVAWTDE